MPTSTQWPNTLQNKFNSSGFEKVLGQTTVASDVDVGPAKVRSRFTKSVDTYKATFNLDFADIPVFEAFYKTTLNNGTLTFLFDDPFTETEQEFRFIPGSAPNLVPIGGRVFTLSVLWERMPS